MKTVMILGPLAGAFVGVLAWQIGSRLSTDAVGMAVGLIFGVLAGIPAALLVAASGRRRDPLDVYSPPPPPTLRELPPPTPAGRVWIVVGEDPGDVEVYRLPMVIGGGSNGRS